MHRRHLGLIFLSVVLSMGAEYRTANFVVTAANPQVAQSVGQWAEHYRREKAMQWLGQEMPTWGRPCPVRVEVTLDGPRGATSFRFGQGQILAMEMTIAGPLDRLIASVLPHEITHTVFAYYFRMPVPRWADEGGSVLSEDGLERDRHDQLVRHYLNTHQQFPLRRLWDLPDYPEDSKVMCMYAQGFSVADYLVKRSDRKTFLAFVHQGMQAGWDNAVQTYYGQRSVEEVEQAWLRHLIDTRRQPGGSGPQLAQAPTTNVKQKNLVRTTVPPAQPLEPMPVFRGAAPSYDQQYGLTTSPIPVPAPIPANANAGWQPAMPSARVQLGLPQFTAPPYTPAPSPVGYPR